MAGNVPEVRDLACGMLVDPAGATALAYRGKTFYFCSAHCAKVFALNPEKFLRHPARPNPYRFPRKG